MTFELVEQSGKISSLFSITSRDYVETLQNLNYEDSPKQYQLNIIATEVETGLKSTAEVIRHSKLCIVILLNHVILLRLIHYAQHYRKINEHKSTYMYCISKNGDALFSKLLSLQCDTNQIN